MTEISRRGVLTGAAGVAVAAALPAGAAPATIPTPAEIKAEGEWLKTALRTMNGFLVSTQPSCGRHGNLGDWGPSVTGYQQDHECFAGIWMDADAYYEGYRKDEIYGPCQCHPKHCKTCSGTGWVEVQANTLPDCEDEGEEPVSIECEACEGSGWIGEPEHPDDRYCEGYEPELDETEPKGDEA